MLNKYSALNKLVEVFSRFASPLASGEINGYRLVSTFAGRELEISLTDGKVIRMPRDARVFNDLSIETVALSSSEEHSPAPARAAIKAVVSPFVNNSGSQRVLYLHSVTPVP